MYICTCTGTCTGDTRSLFRTRGFDQAPRATGIVLMKPFPPPLPSSRHFPRFPPTSLSFFFLSFLLPLPFVVAWLPRCTRQEEWPIDGADNGAAKTRRPSCPRQAAFGILDLNAKLAYTCPRLAEVFSSPSWPRSGERHPIHGALNF